MRRFWAEPAFVIMANPNSYLLGAVLVAAFVWGYLFFSGTAILYERAPNPRDASGAYSHYWTPFTTITRPTYGLSTLCPKTYRFADTESCYSACKIDPLGGAIGVQS